MDIDSLSIVASQQPGIVSFSNFEEVRALLQGVHDYYIAVTYDDGDLKRAKDDLKVLRKAKKVLTDAKKSLKEGYAKPFSEVEAQLDELIGLIKEPEDLINGYIKTSEKAAKQADIAEYAAAQAAVLGDYADKIINSPAFFNSRWLNTTYAAKQWRADIDGIIARAADDISGILAAGGEVKQALLARYYETLTMEGAQDFINSLNGGVGNGDMGDSSCQDDGPVGYKVLKVYASARQMLKLLGEMELAGYEFEELEDGMPKPMVELEKPDFDSFVCFDIETTGTFGISRGDAEAEITEIGAVKVIDGVPVERFSMLANPGRKIVPRIARLTHITDEMVENEPSINEVIAAFADFCRGYVLVGHNVKSCDIPHICRAAKRAGVVMENEYFDTYKYAKRFKDEQGWDNVKLEYLSQKFGLEHKDAHRAWCDAEVNVDVYQKLQQM